MRPLILTAGLALSAGLLPTPGMLFAQETEIRPVTVEGEVLDLLTGLPVAVAIIGVPGIDRSAISDEWGYFKLEEIPVGTYALSGDSHRLRDARGGGPAQRRRGAGAVSDPRGRARSRDS